MRNQVWCLALVLGALAVGCGSNDNNTPDSGTPVDSGTPGVTLTISSGFGFPPDFTVDAGTTIAVKNEDSTPHTVTSETADNVFTPGAVNGVQFNTGDIPAGAGTSISIPASAPSGTVIPYYCEIHKQMMNPPNGHITVR